MPEVEAAPRSNRVRGERHHRGDLFGGEHVVVTSDGRALAGERCDEQAELVPERTMQAHFAERAPNGVDAPLKLIRVEGRNGDRQRRPQQRWMTRRLQVAK